MPAMEGTDKLERSAPPRTLAIGASCISSGWRNVQDARKFAIVLAFHPAGNPIADARTTDDANAKSTNYMQRSGLELKNCSIGGATYGNASPPSGALHLDVGRAEHRDKQFERAGDGRPSMTLDRRAACALCSPTCNLQASYGSRPGGGSGIGRATAVAMAWRGTQIMLSGRRPAELEAAVAAVEEAGGRAEAHPLDVSDADAAVRLAQVYPCTAWSCRHFDK